LKTPRIPVSKVEPAAAVKAPVPEVRKYASPVGVVSAKVLRSCTHAVHVSVPPLGGVHVTVVAVGR
jgi:hypothetical protein